MRRVKDVLKDYEGEYDGYEIFYQPNRRYPSQELVFIESSYASSVVESKIEVNDLFVDSYLLCNEDELFSATGDNDMFEDMYGPDGIVLVIFITHMAYQIFSDENAMTVRDLRTEYIGQFHEYLVCKYRTQSRQYEDDDYYSDYDNNYGYCDDYGDVYFERPSFNDYYFDLLEVIDEPQDVLDKMWAKDSFIIDKSDAEDFFDNVKGYGWWDEESFEEHFADPDTASIMVIILY